MWLVDVLSANDEKHGGGSPYLSKGFFDALTGSMPYPLGVGSGGEGGGLLRDGYYLITLTLGSVGLIGYPLFRRALIAVSGYKKKAWVPAKA